MDSFILTSSDYKRLQGRIWLPAEAPVGLLFFVHGIGEHTACYHDWVQGFCSAGWICAGMDHRGHGDSCGKRGHTRNTLFRDDLMVALTYIQRCFPGIPVFLYGHSMGGLFVLHASYHRALPVQGVISSSPMLGLKHRPSPWMMTLLPRIARLAPSMTFATRIKKEQLFIESASLKTSATDPLMHKRISAGLFYDMCRSASELHRIDTPFPSPLLMIHGTADSVCSVEAVEEFSRRVKGDITLSLWEGGLHELHRGDRAPELKNKVLEWLSTYI